MPADGSLSVNPRYELHFNKWNYKLDCEPSGWRTTTYTWTSATVRCSRNTSPCNIVDPSDDTKVEVNFP
jgi:hypothetical protein